MHTSDHSSSLFPCWVSPASPSFLPSLNTLPCPPEGHPPGGDHEGYIKLKISHPLMYYTPGLWVKTGACPYPIRSHANFQLSWSTNYIWPSTKISTNFKFTVSTISSLSNHLSMPLLTHPTSSTLLPSGWHSSHTFISLLGLTISDRCPPYLCILSIFRTAII